MSLSFMAQWIEQASIYWNNELDESKFNGTMKCMVDSLVHNNQVDVYRVMWTRKCHLVNSM